LESETGASSISDRRHEKLIAGIGTQFKEILDGSRQSVYIYLDDLHKVCNRNFASLLGYRSPKEWSDVKENFPNVFVARKSQQILISAYQDAVTKFIGSTIEVTWKRKDGTEVKSTTILVPIEYDGHAMALHYVDAAVRPK